MEVDRSLASLTRLLRNRGRTLSLPPNELCSPDPLCSCFVRVLHVVDIFRSSFPFDIGFSAELPQGDTFWMLLKNIPDLVEDVLCRELWTRRDSGLKLSPRHPSWQLRALSRLQILPILDILLRSSAFNRSGSFLHTSPVHMLGRYER